MYDARSWLSTHCGAAGIFLNTSEIQHKHTEERPSSGIRMLVRELIGY